MNCSILIVPLFPVGGGFIRPETDGLDESNPYKLLITHYSLWADTRSAHTNYLLLFSSNNTRYEIGIAASLRSSQ